MLSIYSVLFGAACFFGFFQFIIHGRRRMMTARMLSFALFSLYMWQMGSEAGAAASLIAAIGAGIQAAVPEQYLSKTLLFRSAFAIILCIGAVFLCVQNTGDLLPLLAVVNARIVETQGCQQRIRGGLILSQIMWITYTVQQGLYIMSVTETISMLLNMTSIARYERKRKNPVFIKARAG